MSSKSSSASRRKSMFPLRFPSFHLEKDETPAALGIELESKSETPTSESSAGTPKTESLCGDLGDKGTKLERRKSRMDMLANFIFPMLTSSSTEHPPDQHTVYRKPVPAPYQDGPVATHVPFFDSEKGASDRPLPRNQPHSRKPSIPNMLRKVRKSSPDLHNQGHHPPPLPPKEHATIPPVSVTQPQAIRHMKSRERGRSNSLERPSVDQQAGPHTFDVAASPNFPRRSTSAQPPTVRPAHQEHSRVASSDLSSHSRNSSTGDSPNSEGKKLKRGWFHGRSRSSSRDLPQKSTAWVIRPDGNLDYNISSLTNGEKVPELWDEKGNIYVFLGPQGSRLGPSFKVPYHVVSTSRVLCDMVHADMASAGSRGRHRERTFGAQQNLMANDANRQFTPPPVQSAGAIGRDEANIYFGIVQPNGVLDFERLVAVRNLFGFLTWQPLVGTRDHPTPFAAFLQVAALLREFEFSNTTGSSFGELVDRTFSFAVEQLGLADVRHSREKTIEALILGEQMRSAELYGEGFAHAVGKHESILELKSPLLRNISSSTRSRLERARLDLLKRQENVSFRLETFDFPSLFAGIASSQTHPEFKNVRFKEWQKSFIKMRGFVLGHYKQLFGNWPPKARSKKNQFSESGLHRQCLKILYSDLCALYDLLVDRESLTPRVIDQSLEAVDEATVDPRISALRRILTEYDHSSPPVLPPIPYDVPKLPSMTAIREDYNELPAKQQFKFDKSIQPHELLLILLKSRNIDTDQVQNPFLSAFKDFEHREAKGNAPQDMADQRIGYWLFLYVVIQCLPMLVVDAPGLRFTESVESFLCMPVQGNYPWVEDAGEVRKVWYEVSGGNNIVELSADVVMFSVEATYHRSHCWTMAKKWERAPEPRSFHPGVAHAQPPTPPHQLGAMSPLEPPRAVFQDLDPVSSQTSSSPVNGTPPNTSPIMLPLRGPSPGSRNGSPAGLRSGSGHAYRSSIAIGLEPLPLPPPDRILGDEGYGTRPGSSSRPGSRPASRRSESRSRSAARRTGSVANLSQLAKDTAGENSQLDGREQQRVGSGSGSTFDDILKAMEEDKKGKKKKGFF